MNTKVEALEMLLSLSADANATNWMGCLPLHSAVQSTKHPALKRVICAQLLIGLGKSDFTHSDFYDKTPLDYLESTESAQFGRGSSEDEEYFNKMRDALVNTAIPQASLELCQYIQQFDYDGLISYLDSNENNDFSSILEEQNGGLTPLLLAIEETQNLCCRDDETILNEEKLRMSKQIVKILLQRGANPNATVKRIVGEGMGKSILSDNSLHKICTELASLNSCRLSSSTLLRSCLEEIAIELKDHGSKMSEETHLFLHEAARRGHIETAQFLIGKLGVDINRKGRQGLTPLHFAARSGRVKIVRYLLSQNADQDALDDRGKTALEAATVNGKDEVIAVLTSLQV